MGKTTEIKMETTAKLGVISDNGKNTLELRKTKVIRLTEDELFKLDEIINTMCE